MSSWNLNAWRKICPNHSSWSKKRIAFSSSEHVEIPLIRISSHCVRCTQKSSSFQGPTMAPDMVGNDIPNAKNRAKCINLHFQCLYSHEMISVLWKHLIEKHGGKITSALDLSSLSKISDGYTPGHMIQAIQQVITKRRILLQEKRPLTAIEFVAPLAQFSPVFQEEEEALKVLVWFCLMERSLWHLVKYKVTSFVLCVYVCPEMVCKDSPGKEAY